MEVIKLTVDTSASWTELSGYADLLSPQRRERICRLRRDSDKLVSTLTGLLIRSESAKRLDIPSEKLMFDFNSFGKPFVKNSPDFHFSVSHSGRCILFVCNDKPIGIDAEHISQRRMKTAERFFTADECDFINKSTQPDADFFRIWTCKEAYVKMLGTGLSTPLKSFSVLSEGLKSLFLWQERSGLIMTVCCENAREKGFSVKQMQMHSLMENF